MTSLSADNPIVVPESQAERSGIRRGQVKMSKLLGGGFPANVEVLHQLHCLVRLLQWHLGDPSLSTCLELTWIAVYRIFCERLSISTTSTTAIKGKVRSKTQRL